jgi:hypothetical protein
MLLNRCSNINWEAHQPLVRLFCANNSHSTKIQEMREDFSKGSAEAQFSSVSQLTEIVWVIVGLRGFLMRRITTIAHASPLCLMMPANLLPLVDHVLPVSAQKPFCFWSDSSSLCSSFSAASPPTRQPRSGNSIHRHVRIHNSINREIPKQDNYINRTGNAIEMRITFQFTSLLRSISSRQAASVPVRIAQQIQVRVDNPAFAIAHFIRISLCCRLATSCTTLNQ